MLPALSWRAKSRAGGVIGGGLCCAIRNGRRCHRMRSLQEWYCSPVGRLLEAAEREALGRCLDRLTGAAMLQLGGFGSQPKLGANTGRQWLACEGADEPGDCIVDFEQLPFQSNTIDIVVLVHTLDFASRPHVVLREAERVLVPEGTLLTLC